jgi:hypothetical protein
MVVAVVAVRMVQVAVDEIIDVIPMRHGFVTARRAMDVARLMTATVVTRCTLVGVFRSDCERMLVYMVAVHMMQMTVVQIVDVIVVLDCRVPTVRAVLMVVVGVMRFVAGSAHGVLLISKVAFTGIELTMLRLLSNRRYRPAHRAARLAPITSSFTCGSTQSARTVSLRARAHG